MELEQDCAEKKSYAECFVHRLEFKGISKAFPGVKALDNISFSAEGGKVLALLGENGAGKSTLLKIMSGDIRADEGSVVMDGEPLALTSPTGRSILASALFIRSDS
jgi:L-arabinose transport system ATP-binding protein